VAGELGLDILAVRSGGEQKPQLSHLRDLVGGVDGGGISAEALHPLAELILPLLLVLDRGIAADRSHQSRDLRTEPRLELRVIGVGVLEHVVQHRRGEHVIRIAGAIEQGRDLDRVQHERGVVGLPTLLRVRLHGEPDRDLGQGQMPKEAEMRLGLRLRGHGTKLAQAGRPNVKAA
jgi:hypothetical protein